MKSCATRFIIYKYVYLLSLCLDPLFWECILENAFFLEFIFENTFSRMHFAKNSAFGKILKLFIKSDMLKKIVFGWYFKKCIIPIK
jgi:hypothetical protein